MQSILTLAHNLGMKVVVEGIETPEQLALIRELGGDEAQGFLSLIHIYTPSANSSSGGYFSPHSIGHLGYSGCSLWIDLDAGIAITLLSNRTWPDRASQLIREVRPAFHNAIREAL